MSQIEYLKRNSLKNHKAWLSFFKSIDPNSPIGVKPFNTLFEMHTGDAPANNYWFAYQFVHVNDKFIPVIKAFSAYLVAGGAWVESNVSWIWLPKALCGKRVAELFNPMFRHTSWDADCSHFNNPGDTADTFGPSPYKNYYFGFESSYSYIQQYPKNWSANISDICASHARVTCELLVHEFAFDPASFLIVDDLVRPQYIGGYYYPWPTIGLDFQTYEIQSEISGTSSAKGLKSVAQYLIEHPEIYTQNPFVSDLDVVDIETPQNEQPSMLEAYDQGAPGLVGPDDFYEQQKITRKPVPGSRLVFTQGLYCLIPAEFKLSGINGGDTDLLWRYIQAKQLDIPYGFLVNPAIMLNIDRDKVVDVTWSTHWMHGGEAVSLLDMVNPLNVAYNVSQASRLYYYPAKANVIGGVTYEWDYDRKLTTNDIAKLREWLQINLPTQPWGKSIQGLRNKYFANINEAYYHNPPGS